MCSLIPVAEEQGGRISARESVITPSLELEKSNAPINGLVLCGDCIPIRRRKMYSAAEISHMSTR